MAKNTSGVLGGIANALLFIPTVIYMALRESGKWLGKRAYRGGLVRSICVGLVGFALACMTSISSADFLSETLGWSPAAWFVGATVVFVLTVTHIWPALYIAVVRHVWNFGEWLLKQIRAFSKEVLKPAAFGLVGFLRKSPGSDYLWNIVEGKSGGKSWGIRLLAILLFLGAVALSALVGYTVFSALSGILPLPMLAFLHLEELVAGVVGLTVFYVLASTFVAFIDDGEAPATALIFSGLSTYGVVAHTSLFAGASLPLTIAGAAFAFLAGVTYVLPALIAVLQGGLIERVLKAWGRLLDSVYADDENKEFRRFYQHVMNIVIAVAVGLLIHSNIGLIKLPALAGIILSVLAGVYCYAALGKDILNRGGGNALIGLLVSLLSGYLAYSLLPVHFALAGAWLVVAVVVSVFGTGLLLYPFAYMVVRALTGFAAPFLGELLESLHTGVFRVFKSVNEYIRKMQRAAFDDRTGFDSLFGHVGTVLVVVAAVQSILPLAAPFLPAAFWLSTFIVAAVGLNLVILMNRLFRRYSAESFSFAVGITSLFLVGRAVLDSSGDWIAAAVVGLTASWLLGAVFAPAIYLALRAPANLLVTKWLGPVLDRVADFIWQTYVSIWSFVAERFSWLIKIAMVFLTPVIAVVRGIMERVRQIYARLTGGRS